LLKVEGALPHYQIILTRERGLDVIEVQVEVTPDVFGDTVGALERLQEKLGKSIETTVGLRANVRLVQPRTLQRSEGKAKRVLDQRKM
jgi:phenylacetate-CoA ligase